MSVKSMHMIKSSYYKRTPKDSRYQVLNPFLELSDRRTPIATNTVNRINRVSQITGVRLSLTIMFNITGIAIISPNKFVSKKFLIGFSSIDFFKTNRYILIFD